MMPSGETSWYDGSTKRAARLPLCECFPHRPYGEPVELTMRHVNAASSNFCLTDNGFSPDCAVCHSRHDSFCSFLSGKALARLKIHAAMDLRLRNSFLCQQGETLDRIFIILTGVAKLYQILPDGRRQVTGFLGPGDLLGSLKHGQGVHCTAQAVTDVMACTFDREVFLAFLRDFPDIAVTLLIAATDEIEAQHDHAILLGCRNARERVATLLLLLNHRWQSNSHPMAELHLPMTRRDIADHLGLTVGTVSRTFTALKSEGVIEMPQPDIVVLRNQPALLSIAGFEELPVRSMAIGL